MFLNIFWRRHEVHAASAPKPRRAIMGNPFVQGELSSTDLAKAKPFYKSMFDWKLEDVEMGGGMTYTLTSAGDAPPAARQNRTHPAVPSACGPHVAATPMPPRGAQT